MKSQKEKELLLEQLKRVPIVQLACEKVGVSRASFYRWRQDDKEFAKKIDEALIEGSLLVNDMAEAQLISAIKDRNLTGIIYWLRNHHPTYADRLEINANIKKVTEELTPEQEKIIREALRLVALPESEVNCSKNNEQKQEKQK